MQELSSLLILKNKTKNTNTNYHEGKNRQEGQNRPEHDKSREG